MARHNAIVTVRPGDPSALDRALKRLQRFLVRFGFWRAVMDHQEYRRPSYRKRLKSKRARTRERKRLGADEPMPELIAAIDAFVQEHRRCGHGSALVRSQACRRPPASYPAR